MPEVAYKVPEVPKGFLEYDMNGIKVYIQKSAADGAEHIQFNVRGFWIFKTIVASGVKYPRL